MVKELKKFDCNVDNPLTNSEEIYNKYSMQLKKLNQNTYDGIILAVAHEAFKNIGINKINNLCKKTMLFDLKYLFSKEDQT